MVGRHSKTLQRLRQQALQIKSGIQTVFGMARCCCREARQEMLPTTQKMDKGLSIRPSMNSSTSDFVMIEPPSPLAEKIEVH
jgi:hypothetical protein